MIKSYKNDYLVENFATAKNMKRVGKNVSPIEVPKKADVSLLSKAKQKTSDAYKNVQAKARYASQHKAKTAAIVGATAGIAGLGAVIGTSVGEAIEKDMTVEDYIKSKNENVEKSISQDARISTKNTLETGGSLAKDAAGFSKQVMNELCPNCTIYFTIGGIVFILIIVLFYFKK